MKTEKRVILSVLVCATLGFVSCEKQDVKPSAPEAEEIHQLVQRYTYRDQTYQIEYNYDSNDSLLGITGDVEMVQQFQQQEVPPMAYLVEQPNPNVNAYEIHVFDDVPAMNNYQIKEGVSIPTEDRQCSQYTSSGGTANYRFYQHSNYVGELSYLTVNNQSYFQRDFYSAENDKITSLKLWGSTTGASVDIFEHGCFSGKTLRFAISTPGQVFEIPDLTAISFDICVDVIRDVYGNVIQINSYPCGNWNDKISSVKGWSI